MPANTFSLKELDNFSPCPEHIHHGFMSVPVPNNILVKCQQHILSYFKTLNSSLDIINTNTLNDQLTYISGSFSDEVFIKHFIKGMRTFPHNISELLLPWIESDIKILLGAKQIALTHVSALDQHNNSALSPKDYDVYWRCVRPHKKDVAGAHKDSQFADLNTGSDRAILSPFEFKERWRIWFPLFGCNEENSLQLVKDSYKEDIPFSSVETVNGPRPNIESSWVQANEHRFECPIESSHYGAIFRDDVVHRGPENKGPHVRISAEFTLLIR